MTGKVFKSGYGNTRFKIMGKQQKAIKFSIRSFKPGDEANLVDFLNLCYPGGWGSMEQWEYYYPRNPFFDSDNVFIIESNNRIVGHRGFELVDLIIRGKKVPVALLHDTAIHPDYQGLGLYTRLHEATLKAANFKGACLAHGGNSRGSVTYNHNKKTGFIEVKRSPTYIKPINYEKVFQGEVSAFIARRERLKSLLHGLETNLYIRFGKAEFSLDELLNEDNLVTPADSKKGKVRIVLAETSLSLIIQFMVSRKLRKVQSLLGLLFSRKMKIGFSSPLALGKVAWAGIRMVKYV